MSTKKSEITKRTIIKTAGELFAKHGFNGTSTRTIADKAKVNIAAINYHFGSKQNLYTEILLYILNETRVATSDFIEDPSITAEDKLRHIIKMRFEAFLSHNSTAWHGQLIMRALLSPSETLKEIIESVFRPDHEAQKQLIQQINPDISDEDARYWAFSISGQISFYVFGKHSILQLINQRSYPADFINGATEHVTKYVLSAIK